MRVFFARRRTSLALRFAFSTLGVFAFAFTLCGFYATPIYAQAQSNAADLRGFVRDPQGAVVGGANVTATNPATGVTRTATTNDEGFYQIIGVPPGDYEIAIEATNFKRAVVPTVQLTVGQSADLDVALEVGGVGETVTVSGATTELVETSRTAVSNTIDETRIDNLPINERNYLNFALTISTVGRDNGRPIGPAPTSGLNFGGQRGRSNLVQVDGADNTDNSVNAARSTVSQEAVQEFQIVTNSFAAEFGRATGGVVNVVTKGGTNDLRGNVFGFIRNKRIQSRNAFAPIIDGDPNKKPGFTRAQYGATLGGALARDRIFFFAAHEQRRRQESGFFTSDVAQGLGGQVTIGAPFLPFTQTYRNITTQQSAYVTALLTQAQAAFGAGQAATGQALAGAAIQYATLASGGGSTALTGTNPLISPGGAIPAGTPIGGRFFLSGAPVPVSNIAFRPLNSLQRVFPISEGTQFSSLRIDNRINDNNQLVLRGGYNPSEISGIQVESQNQSLGQNDFSRTGIQRLRDSQFVATLTSTLSDRIVNEARFQFGGRRAVFVSQNNDAVSSNISGTAFFGRELFSPVNRSETRYQYVDNVNIVAGNHTLKFGADINYVNVNYIFELNFAGLFNFGGLSATTLAPFPSLSATVTPPDFTPVQQYGIGFPGNFIQGFGNPASDYTNKPFAFFAQDSWKATQRLTVNYGVRYDVEYTRQIAPVGFTDTLTGITLSADQVRAAQDVVGVTQGIPRDTNNIAPRLGVAYDLTGDGRTVIRAAGGLFYDHPLLAIAANSDIADAAQQNQGILLPGSPAPTATLNAVQVFQGTVRPGVTPGLAASAQYQAGRQRFNDQTFFGLGPVLPFTLPIASDFEYAYATQANASIERQLTRDISVSATYLFVGSRHLPKPIDVNAPRTDLQIENFIRYAGSTTNALFPLNGTNAALVTFNGVPLLPTFVDAATRRSVATPANPAAPPPGVVALQPGGAFINPVTNETFVAVIPGIIAQGARGRVISPPIANFFRPSAPNYFLAFAASRGAITQAVLDSQLAGTLRTPGLLSPFGSVNAQSSSGSSNYNAGTLEVKKRFSNNFQFLGSYTLSKSIDDSSDLQTLLLPQDNRNLRAERSLSLFDQRHRFVFSGVLQAPESFRSSNSFAKRVLADFIIAPIFEVSSGRPFNILSNQDTNNDQSSQTDRPSVAADGTLFIPGAFQNGNLARNSGITEMFQQLDLRVARNIRFGERLRLEVIAEGFNLFNRFNQAAASPFITDVNAFNERTSDGRYRSRPTAAFDARQFQFGLRLNF